MDVYYEIFNPLNLTQKLNLDICIIDTIEIRVPVQIKTFKLDLINKVKELGYDIFNDSDPFYKDICSVFTYNNSDISLSERKTILDLSNENFCMKNCNFSNMDIKTLRAICQCKINNNSNDSYINNMVKDNDLMPDDIYDLIKKNINFNKASNIKVVKCISIIFRLSIFTKNYGFYLMFFTNILNCILLFCSPLSTVEKVYNKYCNKIISQLKIIYEMHTIKNTKINENKNQIKKNENENIITLKTKRKANKKNIKL